MSWSHLSTVLLNTYVLTLEQVFDGFVFFSGQLV